MKQRASGVLLHITSLPSRYGIGDLGPEAYKFTDLLAKGKQAYWQVLPVNPPATVGDSYSPYNCLSAFAGNTLLISPEILRRQGLLTRLDIKDAPWFNPTQVEYTLVNSYKTKLFDIAFESFKGRHKGADYETFSAENNYWLEDYAMFIVLRGHYGFRYWSEWPREMRDSSEQALKSAKAQFAEEIQKEKFLQYLFFKQWFALKSYCNQKGVSIIGDIPIYVAYDSGDTWTHTEIFKLTKAKKPRCVSGVPPDYFSKTGQLWGNPIYDWKELKKTGYSWWVNRVKQNLALFDVVRIDHFRGFVASWQVPANQKTAMHGKWVSGPKEDFFNELLKHFPSLPIIVEDLGYITADVKALIEKFEFPSMKVLQFAFGGDPAKNPHYPHNYTKNSVVYTGTHDNNTIKGWFKEEADSQRKKNLFNYFGWRVPSGQIHWELIRLAMSSVSNLAIIPVQDILGLGSQARMNRPATIKGNWHWRLAPGQITPVIINKLSKLAKIYGRA